jgi:hypothetical protein
MARLIRATMLAVVAVLSLSVLVSAQTGGPVTEPTVGLLASTTGIAGVIAVVMNLIRGQFAEATFDRWAALIATTIGVLLAVLYAAFNVHPLDGNAIIEAVLLGLFAGALSNPINNLITKTANGS